MQFTLLVLNFINNNISLIQGKTMGLSFSQKYLPWLTERVKYRIKETIKWLWALFMWAVCITLCYVAFNFTVVKAEKMESSTYDQSN